MYLQFSLLSFHQSTTVRRTNNILKHPVYTHTSLVSLSLFGSFVVVLSPLANYVERREGRTKKVMTMMMMKFDPVVCHCSALFYSTAWHHHPPASSPYRHHRHPYPLSITRSAASIVVCKVKSRAVESVPFQYNTCTIQNQYNALQ